MIKRYELTDLEWQQISSLFPAEYTGKRGRPSKDNRTMLNAMVWLARSDKNAFRIGDPYMKRINPQNSSFYSINASNIHYSIRDGYIF